MSQLRWGFIGTGWIADVCSKDLDLVAINKYAVASRSEDNARAFAESHGFEKYYGGFEAMLQDPNVDVVYVATLNPFHYEHTKAALEAGKHVLCEKPFTINAGQARQIIELARSKNLFLLEAMWVPHFPKFKILEQKIAEGLIGEPKTLMANMSLFQLEQDGYGRMWHKATAGGTLLDLGIYPLHFVSRMLGMKPSKIVAAAQLTENGEVDEDTSAILQFPGGKTGILHSTMSATGSNDAVILGSKGRIEIDKNWWEPGAFRILDHADNVLFEFKEPQEGSGRQYQFLEVERCIKAGLTESPVLTLDDTITVMESMDEIRRQIGVTFEWDK
ncbi:Gfo/Idh/MocA family oxidoreductase [Rhodoluna sp.]|uniref:Gfo/Idh/MocA family protein n=1 Tax=Rhodoluna sp. TaxID=1969481 RepID=UPI0025D52BAD|nr:Gfo/Idh/MocA family oxidoreductase [Rhodoluna sp.]